MSCRTPRGRSASRGEAQTPALFNETVTLHFKHQLLLDPESPALHLRKSAQVVVGRIGSHDGLRGASKPHLASGLTGAEQ